MPANLDRVLELSALVSAERKELGPYMERLTALMKLEDELNRMIIPPVAPRAPRPSRQNGVTQRIHTFLKNNGPQTAQQIIKALDGEKSSISNALSQGKKRGAFSNADGAWSIVPA